MRLGKDNKKQFNSNESMLYFLVYVFVSVAWLFYLMKFIVCLGKQYIGNEVNMVLNFISSFIL